MLEALLWCTADCPHTEQWCMDVLLKFSAKVAEEREEGGGLEKTDSD